MGAAVIYGKQAFIEGLTELGYSPEDRSNNAVVFAYTIKAGKFAEESVMVGLEIPPDFNVTCPPGIHISPRLIAMNPGGQGNDRAAESTPFGSEFQYLSRPLVGWNRTTKDVKAYLRHVKLVLETL